MKELKVPFIHDLNGQSTMEEISNKMDAIGRQDIDELSWPSFQYQPEARFAIGHCNKFLFIKFYVKEKNIKAVYRNTNDPVYRDSCVEFFIAFKEGEPYYNFEFNCAGTCLSGYGYDRHERELLPTSILNHIRRQTVIKPGCDQEGNTEWHLTLCIPVDVFCNHETLQLQGMKSKINFFKCGDDLPQPHYLSWNKVLADEPNFHVPASFGAIEFD